MSDTIIGVRMNCDVGSDGYPRAVIERWIIDLGDYSCEHKRVVKYFRAGTENNMVMLCSSIEYGIHEFLDEFVKNYNRGDKISDA